MCQMAFKQITLDNSVLLILAHQKLEPTLRLSHFKDFAWKYHIFVSGRMTSSLSVMVT